MWFMSIRTRTSTCCRCLVDLCHLWSVRLLDGLKLCAPRRPVLACNLTECELAEIGDAAADRAVQTLADLLER
jgi:hypothetical protein